MFNVSNISRQNINLKKTIKMSESKVRTPKTGVMLSVFGMILARMAELGQLFGSKYDKVKLLLKVNVNDPHFVSTEKKVTTDGREFYVINVVNPDNAKEKISLPISGDAEAEEFEIWESVCNADFTANGKVITKGTAKIRCYAVETE